MLLGQSDAKYKYCPLLKTHDDKMKFCLGSMCMMWRWADAAHTGEDDPGFCGAAGPVLAAATLGGMDAGTKLTEDY
jgi:hypothetical protein